MCTGLWFCAALPDAQLWMVGGGDLASDLKQRVQENKLEDRVRFFGQVSDQEKERLIRNARCLAMPSRGEGFRPRLSGGDAVRPALSFEHSRRWSRSHQPSRSRSVGRSGRSGRHQRCDPAAADSRPGMGTLVGCRQAAVRIGVHRKAFRRSHPRRVGTGVTAGARHGVE